MWRRGHRTLALLEHYPAHADLLFLWSARGAARPRDPDGACGPYSADDTLVDAWHPDGSSGPVGAKHDAEPVATQHNGTNVEQHD